VKVISDVEEDASVHTLGYYDSVQTSLLLVTHLESQSSSRLNFSRSCRFAVKKSRADLPGFITLYQMILIEAKPCYLVQILATFAPFSRISFSQAPNVMKSETVA
jgi:hypothetical protein